VGWRGGNAAWKRKGICPPDCERDTASRGPAPFGAGPDLVNRGPSVDGAALNG